MTSEQYIADLKDALKKLAGVRPVGQEYIRLVNDTVLGGLDYLGQSVTRAMYADLWAWLNDNQPSRIISESEWQAMYTSQNGNVPYYSSGDGSTTFRLPRVVGYFKGAGTVAEVGHYTKEGLPNITGNQTSVVGYQWGGAGGTGALKSGDSAGNGYAGGEFAMYNLTFDASLSNDIFGSSAHVTPETVGVVMGVVAFGIAGTIGEATAEGILAEIANLGSSKEEAGVCLPLNGDKMMAEGAKFRFANRPDQCIFVGSDGGLMIGGGADGAYSKFRCKDDTANPGGWMVVANDGTNGHYLMGYADGRLTSAGAHVLKVKSGSGIGQFAAVKGTANGFPIPSGGSWFCYYGGELYGGQSRQGGAAIVAGGTNWKPGTWESINSSFPPVALAIRIS